MSDRSGDDTRDTRADSLEAFDKAPELAAAILETVDALLVVLDRKGRIVWFNHVCRRTTGYESDEVLNKRVWDVLLAPEDVPAIKRTFQNLRAGRFPSRHVNCWKTKRGALRTIAWTNSAVRGESGRVELVVGTGIDITERVAAEQTLRRSEKLYHSTIDALPIGVVSVDLDLRVLFVNEIVKQWTQQAGCHEDPVNRTELEAFPFLPPRIEDEYRQVLETGLPLVSEETHRFGDRDAVFEVRKIPVFEEGRIVRVITLLEDITERKAMAEAMLSASRLEATATLAGGIAHDFNNLMTGVLGNAQLLAAAFQGKAEDRARLDMIARASERAGELAQLLVGYARGGKYQACVISLNDVVADTLALQEHSFPQRIAFERRLEPELWNVEADPLQMQQVIMNLCINACEAIDGAGRVTIRTSNVALTPEDAACHGFLKPGRHVCLAVEDTGRGMDQAARARLFEPFYTTKSQGRGLGLAAVYGIVKNHNGCLEVKSAPGKGSKFEVCLPAVDAPRTPPRKRFEGDIPTGSETVLFIDDEEAIVDIGRRALEGLGYRVLAATTGENALQLARTFEGPIHAAILDVGMPGLGGAGLLALLREARPDMRVMICSGYEREEVADELKTRGADGFLQKPFRIEQLGRALRELLEG
ncbi:MAG TPA: PAS domain-containing protein [Planctomycetota bacterium]|jgi:PAS domain S-box-containing protein|nr:PAS domain-containing protein [Planctomycetota bacterium]OQC19094.1 MAG: Blue-light-activated protein [Planctomycetes bacterium ADurb.Bin069]HNS00517.1 PAS domain-containing protein [Planctomycetota bacterium]HNU27243.1 PAS domain-containing protein [Planctomycetota bacterium]HOE31156.1 PAS domain-containing protein [Planctomycetota bacterium]